MQWLKPGCRTKTLQFVTRQLHLVTNYSTALEVIVEAVVRPFYLGITLMFASVNLAQGIPLNFLIISSALAPYAFDL